MLPSSELSDIETRVESDLLGDVLVPATALYGAHTQRAVDNFEVNGQRTIGNFSTFVHALVLVKQAAAIVNQKAGRLDEPTSHAIVNSGDRVIGDQLYDQFPIHHLHGGGGASANMNANEVLANLAEELLGGIRGQYRFVHPHNHVNLSQSNVVLCPTVCHIAVVEQWSHAKSAVEVLINELTRKTEETASQMRIARTCLQDAGTVSFGDLFGGYRDMLSRRVQEITLAVNELYKVPLGGAVLAEDDRTLGPEKFVSALCEVSHDTSYSQSRSAHDAVQNLDDMVRISSELDILARGLTKICRDLRLMSSGPETGFCEVYLPSVQAGSSIMPGKVNPVIPEYVIQLCFRIMGLHAACQRSLDHGELELNIWESNAVFSILESMELLCDAAEALGQRCIKGIAVNIRRNAQNVKTLTPQIAHLVRKHGYSQVNDVVKRAAGDTDVLRTLLVQHFADK